MLSALEHRLVEDIIKCKPKFAIYQAILGHIKRSAGLVGWDTHGPKYILNKDGEAVYKGHFDYEKIVLLEKRLTRQFHKALIYKKIWKKYFAIKPGPINDDDVDLYISIVDNAKKIIEARYPGSQFHVIFWDYGKNENTTKVIRGFQRKGIRVHLISHINPDIFNKLERYHLGFDTHPNSLAYLLLLNM